MQDVVSHGGISGANRALCQFQGLRILGLMLMFSGFRLSNATAQNKPKALQSMVGLWAPTP